jgi:uroporphyrinogen III methyltransferase/synthase
MTGAGIVYLVGAGPGDPGLITVAGVEALRSADVVVYDRLAHPGLLAHAPAGAERIYAGKQADRHTLRQEEINDVLAGRAQAGKRVVRLKGGDPFVFGRGGEEAEYLAERGIRFVVIPGVTSAIAAPAYAGIPLTHRDAASSFAVITGHERNDESGIRNEEAGAAESRRRWDRIAHGADTLVFLMGVENLGEIVARLTEHGRGRDTPVALIRWGTWAGMQETLTGTLADIVERVRAAGFKAPAVTVVGDVVKLRSALRWYDVDPLFGKRIVVTRARTQASALISALRSRGAEPIEFPLIRSACPVDGGRALMEAVGKVEDYSWICFSSANAVSAFADALRAAGKDARALAAARIAAVGPATEDALREARLVVDYVPDQFTGAALAESLPEPVAGSRILALRAEDGEEALVETLRARGAAVDAAPAYRTVIDGAGAEIVKQRLAEGSIDSVTFTSSSTVKNFASALGVAALPAQVAIACIGPTTARTAEELLGRPPDIVAEEHSINGLLDALEAHYVGGGTAIVPAAPAKSQ